MCLIRHWCRSLNFVIQDFIFLSVGVKFSLSSANSSIALVDGQQAITHGLGHFAVYLGPKEFEMHLIVAGVEDEGMGFLSQTD